MQIDFHHAVTYVAARLAGFADQEAAIISHAAQYVDDATAGGTIHFNNKAMYHHIASAHRMLDTKNLRESLANHQVWLPFHFLPGNNDLEAGAKTPKKFIEKIICKPNSPIARDMINQVIVDRERPYGLHRLGIAMHIYADTWAHQGFAGILNKINEVEDAREVSDTGVFSGGLATFWRDLLDDTIPPLGHGRATVFPDMPFLTWKYENGHGTTITRNNTDDFCSAADHLCKAMKRYRLGDSSQDVNGIDKADLDKIRKLFMEFTFEDADTRHAKWVEKIKTGYFSFGPVDISYSGKGKTSWKVAALNSNFEEPLYTFKDDFMESNWKLFHDALQAHRLYILHDLLPKYDICAA